jgi:hypothetical protein
VQRPRDPFEDSAELRAGVAHLSSDMSEVKHGLLRLDDRLFQLILLQLGTLATALASLVAALLS